MTLSAMSPQNRLIDSVAVTVQLPDLQENLTPMRSKMQSTQTSRIKGGARLRRSHARLVQAGLLTLSLLAGSLGLAAPLPPLQLPPARHSADKMAAVCSLAQTVARNWNEQTLAAIRLDAPRPTVHARNLFHVSLAMYEAWAAYAPEASAWRFDESAAAFGQPQSNREIAISHAAYRVLVNRFSGSPGASSSLASFAACMQATRRIPAPLATVRRRSVTGLARRSLPSACRITPTSRTATWTPPSISRSTARCWCNCPVLVVWSTSMPGNL